MSRASRQWTTPISEVHVSVLTSGCDCADAAKLEVGGRVVVVPMVAETRLLAESACPGRAVLLCACEVVNTADNYRRFQGRVPVS
jgi:hypothetical protein